MSEPRAEIDISELPTHAFGSRTPAWWGTVGFMAIEGASLMLLLATLLYIRKNFEGYPPPGTPAPELLVPTIGVLLFLASIVPARAAVKAAKRHDIHGLRRMLVALLAVQVLIIGVRIFEFDALNTRFDTNAYGSAVWFIVGLHSLLLLADFAESFFIAAIFFLGPVEKKHFADAADDVFYWYFLIAAWLPCYVLVFLGQYFL